MKLLMISDRMYGCGASIAAFRLANAMAEYGRLERITYAYVQPGDPEALPAVSDQLELWQFGRSDHPAGRLAGRLVGKYAPDRAAAFARRRQEARLLRFVRKHQPDVVHLHNNYLSSETIIEIEKHSAIAWTLHDLHPITGYNYRIRTTAGDELLYDRGIPVAETLSEFQQISSRCHRIGYVAPSTWMHTAAGACLPEKFPIVRIENTIDKAAFFPEEKSLCKKKLGLPPERPCMLLLQGQHAQERKNAQVLFDLIAGYPEDVAEWTFLIVGASAPPAVAALGNVFSKREVHGESVLRQTYSAADCLCLPSLEENYPNVGVEAVMCGTPIIGSQRGGIPDLALRAHGSVLFDPYRIDSLGEAIKAFRSRPPVDPMRLHVDFARIHAGDDIARRHLAFYRQIIA